METFLGIMIPFLGTTLGAACVFFMKKSLGDLVQRALAGFAAGVMVAASIWSLLIPAIEQSEGMGKLSFLPAFIGFWVGVLFLLLLDRLIPERDRASRRRAELLVRGRGRGLRPGLRLLDARGGRGANAQAHRSGRQADGKAGAAVCQTGHVHTHRRGIREAEGACGRPPRPVVQQALDRLPLHPAIRCCFRLAGAADVRRGRLPLYDPVLSVF